MPAVVHGLDGGMPKATLAATTVVGSIVTLGASLAAKGLSSTTRSG